MPTTNSTIYGTQKNHKNRNTSGATTVIFNTSMWVQKSTKADLGREFQWPLVKTAPRVRACKRVGSAFGNVLWVACKNVREKM